LLISCRSNPNSHPHYSIRLFSTSSDHYRPPNAPYQASSIYITNRSIPIEYPSTPDVIVDGHVLVFKERGLRGKAGSAPPFDLDRSSRGIVLNPGRVTAVVMGHSGPTLGKRKDEAKVRLSNDEKSRLTACSVSGIKLSLLK